MIVVTGMHRSGTSAMAGALTQAGLNPGKHLVGPGIANARGHFEPSEIVAFNDKLLQANGASWADPPEEFKFTDADIDAAKKVLHEVWGKDRHAVCKDPRITLCIPFWKEVFPANTLYVFMLRHCESVAKSLLQRDGFSLARGRVLWKLYNYNAALAAPRVNSLFVKYERLVAEPREVVSDVLAQAGKTGKAEEGAEFIDPALCHHVAVS